MEATTPIKQTSNIDDEAPITAQQANVAVPVMSPVPLDEDAFVAAPVARRDWLGGISVATEWRWAKELDDFPKAIKIHRNKYYRVGDLRNFVRARAVA
jgi:hypothetical protein